MSPSTRTKTIPALEDVPSGRFRVLVEKSGVPMVGIISADEFRRLIAEREARFAVVGRICRRIPDVPNRTIQRDVRATVSQVRRRRRA